MKTTMKSYCILALCAMALGFLVLEGHAYAQQRPADKNKEVRTRPQAEADDQDQDRRSRRPQAERRDTERRTRAQADDQDVEIPSCLEKLTLTQQQKDQIKDVVRSYNEDLSATRREFGEVYLQAIRTEVLLLSAIEDNLTDAQRKQVREQRRQTARHQKSVAGTEDKSNQSTAQPTSAVEQQISIVGISLTREQERAADKLQEQYLSELRSLNRDIEGLHIQMVSLEADMLVEIENLLTKDQLQQLRENRKTAPAKQASAKQATAAESR